MKTEEEAGSQGTRGVIHVINGTTNVPVPELAATVTYSFVCINLEAGAILTSVHALIIIAFDSGVPLLVMGRNAECTAYLRLLRESLADIDLSMYNMMAYNTSQETSRYCSHAIHMYLVVPEGCQKPKVCVIYPCLYCTTFPVHHSRYVFHIIRCRGVSCTIPRTYITCLRTSFAF